MKGFTEIARILIKRWGIAEKVAYFVSYLLSHKANYMPGPSIEVDGGNTTVWYDLGDRVSGRRFAALYKWILWYIQR